MAPTQTRRPRRPSRDRDAADRFFEELTSHGAPVLHNLSGTLRLELRDADTADHVLVAFDRGEVRVAHRSGRADAVVRVERALFDQMVVGEANAMAALLRGAIDAEGDLRVLTAFTRLLPGPPASQRSFAERQGARP